MYFLPKVHKPNMPMSLILSVNSTTAYYLSRHLVFLLSDLTMKEFTIKNTYEFSTYINSLKESNKYVMCSFDVELFFHQHATRLDNRNYSSKINSKC